MEKFPEYGEYDFCIALHVLEHTNSLMRGVKNTIKATKRGGVIYLALPDKNSLEDRLFIENYGISHHAIEYFKPKIFLRNHLERLRSELGLEKYKMVTVKDTYMHRHTYDMDGYTKILGKIRE